MIIYPMGSFITTKWRVISLTVKSSMFTGIYRKTTGDISELAKSHQSWALKNI